MRAGELDRSIVIQAKTSTQDSYGQPVDTWAKIHSSATLPAKYTGLPGSEGFTDPQFIGRQLAQFKIRFRDDVTVLSRIVYNGRIWDIQSVVELGRREGLTITATARAE